MPKQEGITSDNPQGLKKAAVQTEEAFVSASDYEQLGTSLAASVDETQQAQVALAKKTADLDGLLVAIIRRKRIDMDGMRYNVWCEGEAAGLGSGRAPSRRIVCVCASFQLFSVP